MRFIIVETSDTLFEFEDMDKALEWIGTLCKNSVRFTVKHSNGVKCAEEIEIERAQARYAKTRKQIELKRALLRAA